MDPSQKNTINTYNLTAGDTCRYSFYVAQYLIDNLINTPLGKKSQFDDYSMRRAAITRKVPYVTTLSAASAACDGAIALRSRRREVMSLQERFGR